jgi:hypothetical protein
MSDKAVITCSLNGVLTDAKPPGLLHTSSRNNA